MSVNITTVFQPAVTITVSDQELASLLAQNLVLTINGGPPIVRPVLPPDLQAELVRQVLAATDPNGALGQSLQSYLAGQIPGIVSSQVTQQFNASGGVADASVAGYFGTASATRTAADARYRTDSGSKPVGKNELFINVRDYGAVGDGTTNDTSAISSAIAALPSNGNGTSAVLYFPAGTYLHSGVVVSQKSGFEITGPGVLVAAAAWQQQYVRVVNCADFRISGIRSRHQNPTARRLSPARCFSIENCARFVVTNVQAYSGEGVGIMVQNSSDGTVSGSRVADTLADGIGMYDGSHHITIVGNYTQNTGDDAISVVGVTTDSSGIKPYDIAITGNVVRQARARGIVVVGGDNVTVSANVIDETTTGGIYITREPTRSTFGSTNVVVSNNVVGKGNTYMPTGTNLAAIHVVSSDAANPVNDVVIVGNLIHDHGWRAIQIGGTAGDLTAVQRVLVSNNTVTTTTGGGGLYVYGAVDVSAVNNRLANLDGPGVYMSVAATGVVRVEQNTVRNANRLGSSSSAAVIGLVEVTATDALTCVGNFVVASQGVYGIDAGVAVAYGNSTGNLPIRGGSATTHARGVLALSAVAAPADVAGGSGVVALRNAATAPTANPANGVVFYAEGGVLKVRTPNGVFTINTTAG